MRKIMYVLVMLFLVAGCATSGDIKKMNSNVQKIAKVTAENRQLIKDHIKPTVNATEVAVVVATEESETPLTPEAEKALIIKKLKAPAPPSALVLAKRSKKVIKKAPKEVSALLTLPVLALQVEELAARTSRIEEQVDKIEKRIYPNLGAYVRDISRQLGTSEAKHRFAGDPTGKLTAYFVGPFTTDKFGLTSKIKRQLVKAKTDMKNKNLKPVGIHASASIGGDLDYNQILSETRAKTIANWLKEKELEVPADKVRGLGETTEFGRAKDNQCAIIFAAPAPTP